MAASIRHVLPGYFNFDILTEPVVIKNVTNSWPCSQWKIEYLAELLGDDKIPFRLGRKNVGGSGFQFEGDCKYEEATMKDFCEWCQHNSTKEEVSQVASLSSRESHRESQSADMADQKHSEGTCRVRATREESGNPLMSYERTQYWCYADYKRMKDLFMNCPSVLEDVRWKDLGFSDYDGRQSTIWIGSEGANTPCHQDTYGFNLVAQIQGRKKWHLFPPSQTELMYPTRIPYEESSVFSRVSVKTPDLQQHPKFGRATPYIVVLEPGDILFVPKLWWHFVESLDVSISINCWMDLESDNVSRVDEAIVRTLVCGLMSLEGQEGDGNEWESSASWLNPTEEATSASINLALLGEVVATALTHCSKASHRKEETSVVNLSENQPEALIKLEEGNPSLIRCHASENDTSKENFEGNFHSDEKRGGDTPVKALVEEMDSESNKGMPLHQQTSNAYCPPNLSKSPITINPIHGGSPTQGLVANSDSGCGELGRWQERKGEIEGTDQGQNQSDSVKRIKLCDDVIIPGSRMAVARHSVYSVPCHGSVTELTASHRGNDGANLKIEQETRVPSSAALETSDSFVDVTMATVVECLTQPNIIALLREGLLEKVRSNERRGRQHFAVLLLGRFTSYAHAVEVRAHFGRHANKTINRYNTW